MATPSFLAHGFAEDRQRGVLKRRGRNACSCLGAARRARRGGVGSGLGRGRDLVRRPASAPGPGVGIIGAPSCCSSTSRRQASTLRTASGVGSGRGAARPGRHCPSNAWASAGTLPRIRPLARSASAAGSRPPAIIAARKTPSGPVQLAPRRASEAAPTGDGAREGLSLAPLDPLIDAANREAQRRAAMRFCSRRVTRMVGKCAQSAPDVRPGDRGSAR